MVVPPNSLTGDEGSNVQEATIDSFHTLLRGGQRGLDLKFAAYLLLRPDGYVGAKGVISDDSLYCIEEYFQHNIGVVGGEWSSEGKCMI